MSIPSSITPLFSTGAGGAAGYQVERSLRFNSSDSAYLSKTFGSPTSSIAWTWASWVKKTLITTSTDYRGIFECGAGSNYAYLDFSDNGIRYANRPTTGTVAILQTTPVYRDASAWFHVVFVYDSANGTSTDRLRLYVNGTRVTTFSSSTYPDPSQASVFNSAVDHRIGRDAGNNGYLDGYLADIYFIDGQALDATAFTEVSATTGQLIPKAYAGTYTGNSFWLKFNDNSAATDTTLGKDSFLLGNNWTPFNVSTSTGGPTSVAAASGALPVYNTTGTYGTVKGTGTRTDTNSASIVLAIPMDGTNNGTTFTDESATIKGSGSAKTITRYNAITSTVISNFYGSSGYFDGSGDYLSISNSVDFDFGSGNSTLEVWVYPTDVSTTRNILSRSYTGGTGNYSGFILSTSNFLETTTQTAWDVTISRTLTVNTWQHLAIVRNSNTWTYYINGVSVGTATVSGSVPTGPSDLQVGRRDGQSEFQGYMSDVRLYKGVAKYTSNFNPPSSTANATVAAGNDSLVDTPTSYGTPDTGVGGEVRGNYATLNPLSLGPGATLSNGNLEATTSAADFGACRGTIGVSSGKCYFEVSRTGGVANIAVGIVDSATPVSAFVGNSANSYSYYGYDGKKVNNSNQVVYGSSYTTNDIVGVALDLDAGTLTFYKNGVSQGQAFSGISGTFFPAACDESGGSAASFACNFGQRPFAYTAPSGFKALCDTNIAEGTITTSGTFTGNANADGPFVYLNGVPTAMTINSNSITFGTHADKLSNGFKVRNSTSTYNIAGINTVSVSTTGAKFKFSRAQPNP